MRRRPFLRDTACPAFESVVLELRALDVHAELRDDAEALAVEVIDDSGDESLVLFAYGVQLRSYRTMTFTVLEPQKEARGGTGMQKPGAALLVSVMTSWALIVMR